PPPARKIPIVVSAVMLGAVGVVLASNTGVGKSLTSLFAPARVQIITKKVIRDRLLVTVTERGNLESSQNEDVYNEVEGQTQIIYIVPEGQEVKKGDIVCKLDDSALQDQLLNQEIATKRAEADYMNAVKTREVAEYAVEEYKLGIYPQDLSTVEGEITLAMSDLARAKDRVKWSDDMLKKKYVSQSQNLAEHLAVQKADISEKQAKLKKQVLETYTKKKQLTELMANVEKAKADELAKEATLNLEQQKEKKLRRQIEKCTLRAPKDGIVVYANDPNQRPGSNQVQIEEGATVRQNQKIFSLPDIRYMQVNTKVHESMLEHIRPGLRARVRVESVDQEFNGRVKRINTMPDAGSWLSSDVKVYTTIVDLDTEGKTSLKPGMSAMVEILVDQLDNVLVIPVMSVLEMGGKDYVYVVTPEGPQRRTVVLGTTNDKIVEVKEGLKEGEQVAMNPEALLTDDERRALANSTSKNYGKAKDWGNGPAAASPGLAPGKEGAGESSPAKAKGKGKAKGKRGGRGAMSPAEREAFLQLSPDEQRKALEARGVPPERIDGLLEMMRNGGPPGG
ncbi:MAG: HlyD family efflux transporter periplasmic adaptor subunit, partial [Isosphaeraceae bacterium]|nr:HlyD family efflux transporter periplasmic adaptor subunit [Isosphaeraceae bacterium]